MLDPIGKLGKWPSNLVIDFVRGEVLHKADTCAEVLAEARRLSLLGKYGTPLSALVARATALLDDVDEMLVALDPLRDGQAFAAAAAVHRQLEQIETAMTAVRRGEARAAKSIGKR